MHYCRLQEPGMKNVVLLRNRPPLRTTSLSIAMNKFVNIFS